MIGAHTILLTNLIGFSPVVNRASRVAEPQIYDRGTSCAGFATGLSTPTTGTIRPFRITYSRLPQRIRFEPKLASQITKWIASRRGTSQNLRRNTASPTPQNPTVQATDKRNTKYAT